MYDFVSIQCDWGCAQQARKPVFILWNKEHGCVTKQPAVFSSCVFVSDVCMFIQFCEVMERVELAASPRQAFGLLSQRCSDVDSMPSFLLYILPFMCNVLKSLTYRTRLFRVHVMLYTCSSPYELFNVEKTPPDDIYFCWFLYSSCCFKASLDILVKCE